MPELREVFDMTTKHVEPDVDMWREQEKRQRRSSRSRKIGAFAVAAAIGLVALVLVLVNRTGVREGGVLVPATQAPSQTPSVPFFVDLQAGNMTPLPDTVRSGRLYFASPDRTMLVYSWCCSSPNPVFVANVDGTGVRQITPDGTDGFAAQWSPDGSMLVYQQRDGLSQQIGNLVVVDVATGETTQVTDLDPAKYGLWMLSPSFSPDGESILFHLPRGPIDDTRWDLWSVPVGGGDPMLEVRDASMGDWAPAGGTLAYVDSPRGDWSSSRLMVRDSEGGAKVLVEGNEIAFARWSPDGTRIAYSDSGVIHIVDVSTGEVTQVAEGGTSDWFGDDGLIVVPDRP
jgi:dipeptidyl aminopeptidase/acylaminoacyl peptidase